MYSFSHLEPVCCSMSSSNCCFLTCIQVSQEAGQVVWYSHLIQNFSQFIVIHTVKGFGIVNKTEIDIFLEFSCFFNDPADVGNLISGSSAFSKSSLNISWRNLSIILLVCEMSAIVWWFEHSWALPFSGIEMNTDLFQFCGHCWVFQSSKFVRRVEMGKQRKIQYLVDLLSHWVSGDDFVGYCHPW